MGFVEVYDLEISEGRIPHLVKVSDTEIEDNMKITNIDKAVDIVEKIFGASKKAEEVLYLLCIDTSGKVNGAFIVSRGCISWTMINMKGIFTRALLCGAEGIILAHNHPSGETHVSKPDKRSIKGVWRLCKLMELNFMDYLIIGKGCYESTLDLISELNERGSKYDTEI